MNLVKLFKYLIFISFLVIATGCETTDTEEKVIKAEPVPKIIYTPEAVSYTHLTLPTMDSV